MKRFLYLIVLLALLNRAHGQSSEKIDLITLKDSGGQSISLKQFSQKPLVIVFLGAECPVSQKYISRLKTLQHNLKNEVILIGVFPYPGSQTEADQFKKEYEIDFTLLLDTSNKLVTALGATITPEVFLLNKERTVTYSGAIDNWFYDLGKYRPETSQHYLKDAIESILKNEAPVIKKTDAVGCTIQSSPGHSHAHH